MQEEKTMAKMTDKTKKPMTKEEREKQIADHILQKKTDSAAKKKEAQEKAIAEKNKEIIEKHAAAKEKPAKEENDEDMLSVSDVARSLDMDPKFARAKLRRAKGKSPDGRWPKVRKDSKEHAILLELLKTKDDEDDEDEDDDE